MISPIESFSITVCICRRWLWRLCSVGGVSPDTRAVLSNDKGGACMEYGGGGLQNSKNWKMFSSPNSPVVADKILSSSPSCLKSAQEHNVRCFCAKIKFSPYTRHPPSHPGAELLHHFRVGLARIFHEAVVVRAAELEKGGEVAGVVRLKGKRK